MNWLTAEISMSRFRFIAWLLLMWWLCKLANGKILPAFMRGIGL